jgi:hypothetical protein
MNDSLKQEHQVCVLPPSYQILNLPLAARKPLPQVDVPTMPTTQAILVNKPASGAHPGLMVRLAGDRYVQLEYGPMELDVNLR